MDISVTKVEENPSAPPPTRGSCCTHVETLLPATQTELSFGGRARSFSIFFLLLRTVALVDDHGGRPSVHLIIKALDSLSCHLSLSMPWGYAHRESCWQKCELWVANQNDSEAFNPYASDSATLTAYHNNPRNGALRDDCTLNNYKKAYARIARPFRAHLEALGTRRQGKLTGFCRAATDRFVLIFSFCRNPKRPLSAQ